MEIPIKMDDLGVPPFSETPICSCYSLPSKVRGIDDSGIATGLEMMQILSGEGHPSGWFDALNGSSWKMSAIFAQSHLAIAFFGTEIWISLGFFP